MKQDHHANSPLWVRIIIYIIIVAAILFFGFYLVIFAVFSGNDFYVPVIIISAITLMILTLMQMIFLIQPKKMKIPWIAFLSILTLSCGVYEAKNAYDKSILRVKDGNIDLRLYAPFTENTKAVSLNEPATLQFETDLPKLDGATALYPLYAAFAQAVYPKKQYDLYSSEVACNNTIHSYQSLINKNTDIIFVAQPSKEQLEMAETAGVTFRYTPIGKEAFVFFVNAHNSVNSLTIKQLHGIYSGEITNWKELGGNDDVIRPFQRNANSGSQTAFLRFMKGKAIMKPPLEDVVGGMGGIIAQTADYANYHNAIGFSFRFYAKEMVNNNEIKLLKINNIYPDLETIRDESYPLSSSFFAITLSDNNKPNVQALLDWILSKQGQYLVEKTGYCPVK